MNRYGVILFYTTSSAMRAEKLLKKANLTVKLVPVPRQFSSDCGIALRFGWPDKPAVESILTKESVEYEAIHELT